MAIQRLGLIGDVHAQQANLQLALAFLQTQDVEEVLCTGDIVDGPIRSPLDTPHCIRLLQEHGVLAVRGNHDRWLLADQMRALPHSDSLQIFSEDALAFLRGLPSTLTLETRAGKLLLCHGMGTNDMQTLKPDDDFHSLRWKPELQELIDGQEYSYVVAGHTHQRMLRRFRRFEGALTVINAGTLLPDLSPCFSILDFRAGKAQFFNLQKREVTPGQLWEL